MLRVIGRRFISTSLLVRNAAAPGTTPVAAPLQLSSCAEGTSLNLKIMKSGKEPVALKDEEYPAWLWTLLDKKAQEKALKQDEIAYRKKQLRKANIKKIKSNNFLAQM